MPFHLVHHCQTNGTKFYIVTKPLSLSANPMGFQLLWLSTGLGVRFTIAIHWKNPWTTIAKYAAAPQTTLCMPCLHTFILRKLEQWVSISTEDGCYCIPTQHPHPVTWPIWCQNKNSRKRFVCQICSMLQDSREWRQVETTLQYCAYIHDTSELPTSGLH
jgi:hypothetical protein